MNQTLVNSSKKMLKEMLAKCTEPQQQMFKRMYSHKDLTVDINTAVDNMDETKIDWAMTQIERTIEKNEERNMLK